MSALGKQITKPAAPTVLAQERIIKELTTPACIAESHSDCCGAYVHIEQPIEYRCKCVCHEGASA